MEGVKKWLTERTAKKNGLYVHYSPPKLLEVVSSAQLRQWARGGAGSKLERAVLAGQGRRVLAETVPASTHLKTLVAKCDALHAAVEKGSLLELQALLDMDYNRKKYVICRDRAGVGLLHKAIFYGYLDIAEYLVQEFPELVHQKDSEGRTPLHYTAACQSEAAAAALLERAGAARGARDAAGHTPAHYRGAARTLLTLPLPADMPPDPAKNPTGLVIKRHNIRIWCHDCDMGKLQRVVWEGHGARLLSEVSNQPVVKKFLEAVPYIMNTIRDIHSAVIQNDLEGLMKHSGDPVPPQILSSRDANNMTVMHKAAGLGHGGILGYIADRYPQGINDIDNDGRTPLHYAAAVKDDQHMYNTLVSLGADEGAVDNKNRTPGYYVNRPQEIDKGLFKVLPEAPRTPSSAYPPSWDWKILDTEAIVELNKKSRRKNFKASNENISSKTNSNSISENINNRRGMKNSSTQELIKTLPELDDKRHNGNNDSNKDSDVVEEHAIKKEEDDKTEEEEEKSAAEEVAEPIEHEEHDDNEASDGGDDHIQEDNDNNEEHIKTDIDETSADNDHASAKEPEKEDHSPKDESGKENDDLEPENTNTDKGSTQEAQTNEENQNHSTEHEENDEEITDDQQNDKIMNENHNRTDDINNKDNEEETPENKNTEEEIDSAINEGNNNYEHNEDDDDVQVQGDSHSEYSDIHQRSTAEATDTASAKRGNDTDGPNTQESLIEGIISGEAEKDSEDASITQRDETVQGEILVVDSEIDPEVAELINTANMEMLATLVLNGEGSRLVGRRSGNTELQSFLDNVPIYMQKINKVHVAAREGNIKDLQAALDRRKFAIARDPISPNGATPLHVATISGKTNIIKYLGGRFPETLSAVDFEGRTALHYAAVIPDNGHYYNLLQQLGANAKDLDDNGRSADDYFNDPSLLPYNQLLSDFGIDEETAQSMLSDKGTSEASQAHMDIPVFKTDEGRYLAKSLGDPLIKGLTEVANVKPKDPVAFLASFLHNFPEHEKPRLGTQESNVLVMKEAAEVENDQPPTNQPGKMRSAARTATRPHRPIDVVTVDPQSEASPDAPEAAFSSVNRDEHGQSMLHFAAARPHTRNALFQLLQESDISLGYRDELYRTARDVSIQANVLENTGEIDRWVLHLAARGNTEKIMQLLLEGYDHILDIVDEEGVPITEVVAQRGDTEMTNVLASIPVFEEHRESLHGAVRRGDVRAVQEAIAAEGGRTLARSMNSFGRTALHVAVLAQHEDVVDFLAHNYPELLRIGDNLERTPLHYAMGIEKMESISRILIRAGSKRVLKDLKGRQPSYYFMNKSDILRLKEEEEVY